MSELKRIGVGSAFKLTGFLYLFIGFIFGALITLAVFAGFKPGGGGGMMSLIFGTLAIVILPILYGVLGAIAGVIGALLYNISARVTGGLDLELE